MLIQFPPLHGNFWLLCQEAAYGHYCKGKSVALLQDQFCLFSQLRVLLIQICNLAKHLFCEEVMCILVSQNFELAYVFVFLQTMLSNFFYSCGDYDPASSYRCRKIMFYSIPLFGG
uniref:Uncharacterized protein n=1 Tax=Arundo donax TaxID=35708 RepID=A0A0A8YCV6_ARUDO